MGEVRGNYRGTEGVRFVWNGCMSDPELLYDGKLFNYYDIENALWDMFVEYMVEECGVSHDTIIEREQEFEDDFDRFVQDNCVNYLEDCIYGGYAYKTV